MKTIRKLNGIIGLGTQSGSDILQAADPHTIIQQTQTKIFFGNPDADRKVHCEDFSLSDAEFRWLTRVDKTERSFLIKHGRDSVVARLNLKDMPDIVKVLSSDKDSLAEMDRLRARHDDNLEKWLPEFMNAGGIV
jgi:type IV secretion system protein VirB4